MKKGLLSLLLIFTILSLGSYIIVKQYSTKNLSTDNDKNTLVSSFYPEYIITKNIISGCDDIQLINMTSNMTGCIHDYQLTSADMKVLKNADAFIINGGGMETFLDEIASSYPKLRLIDSSEGITLLKNNSNHDTHSNEENTSPEHDHDSSKEQDHEDHDHGIYNAHIWLNPDNYIKQIKTITKQLNSVYPEFEKKFNTNSNIYINKIKKLKKDIKKITKDSKTINTIIFHDSFAYLSTSFNINIIDSIDVDADSSLSAGTIADTISKIKHHNIKVMLSEKQFKENIANNISKETDAKIYVLDSLIYGDDSKDAYINGMYNNLDSLKSIYKE